VEASERGRLHPALPESEDLALPVQARGLGASEEPPAPHRPPDKIVGNVDPKK